MTKQDIAGVVLAGGRSSRMKRDKRFLLYNNMTFLDITVNNLESIGCSNIVISGSFENNTKYPCIKDETIDIGPIAGILSVLKSGTIKEKHIIWLPVDMPKLNTKILTTLLNTLSDNKLAMYSL